MTDKEQLSALEQANPRYPGGGGSLPMSPDGPREKKSVSFDPRHLRLIEATRRPRSAVVFDALEAYLGPETSG